MIKNIPFGEHNLSQEQVARMAKALWENPDYPPCAPWHKLSDIDKESFIREFILTIPKTIGVIGLKVVKK